ncbi:Methyltransferase domain-containing protein [Lentzea albidocapillata subsp. violacea]|uniref:Methyltransferase domain-containing protein n=1 Tax=Lentzea albidocapillata subsp. violacea TaxID=128104 RepID=A0A1G9TN93_9PSEU|nr:methyltransferase domain-containing protein [Lentzea albidocapillata]SDM48894.1 Methyltransferase domain-containing protein [Lentzea albidocapillata subsp. violacea]
MMFDQALKGHPGWLDLPGTISRELSVARWHADADGGDSVLLDACTGPTLDVGCGPGRLVAALLARRIQALGVDVSPEAVRRTTERGGIAIRRDVFDLLPGEGHWQHVLLADGNIGIGGDPAALLRRVRNLLRPSGTVVVEVEPPGAGLTVGQARVRTEDTRGQWFPWAWSDAESLIADGFFLLWQTERAGRWFACWERL